MRSEEIEEPPLKQVLKVAQEASQLAGSQIRDAWSSRSEVKHTKSSSADLVTETDQKCEELVIQHILSHFPEHEIIGEESCGSDKYTLTDSPTWTIDPIDGTTNFVHRLALSCVIISFLVGKEVLVGVVYDPLADELFWAVKGKGAFLKQGCDEEKESVSIHVSNTESISQAVISMDPGYGRSSKEVESYCGLQSAILREGVRNIRVFGCTGLNMAYVACGRLDAGFEIGSWESNLGPKIWDFSAGKLLVQEAGGLTRDISESLSTPDERPLDLMGRSFFVAATSGLANSLLGIIALDR